MHDMVIVICCCCKRKVQVRDDRAEMPCELAGWVSIERKPFCESCCSSFTEEDHDWLTQPPVPLGSVTLAQLIPGDVEPLS